MMLIKPRILQASLKDYKFKVVAAHKRIFAKWRDDRHKEKSIQADFLNDIFGKILGYEVKTDSKEYHLEKEYKTEKDATQTDGVLGYFSKDNKDVRVVIELKGKNTKNFTEAEKQTFEYRDKINNVEWVIISNTAEIRLYSAFSGGRIHHESFMLSKLAEDDNEIRRFHLLFSKDNLFTKEKEKSPTHTLISETDLAEKNIEKKFMQNIAKSALMYGTLCKIRILMFCKKHCFLKPRNCLIEYYLFVLQKILKFYPTKY